MDARLALSGYLEEQKNNYGNPFIQFIKKSFEEGNIDHNKIRRAVLECVHAQDKNGIFYGSLLMQLDRQEAIAILNEKLAS